ncbi:MAG: DUF4301 family protein [Salibacteraceae bacterium]
MANIDLSEADWQQLTAQGITSVQIQQQIQWFKTGFPFADLVRPCTPGDGIVSLDDQLDHYINVFHNRIAQSELLKFVPASGAATRMFKQLFLAQENPDYPDVQQFVQQLKNFAFYRDLQDTLEEQEQSVDALQQQKQSATLADALLSSKGLHYGQMPKGLIAFHQYEEIPRTPLEEHLVEGAMYAQSADGIVRLHFTVSEEHLARFKNKLTAVGKEYESRFGVRYEVTFSLQNPASQTLAVDPDNQPFRDEAGHLVLRPAGHGALLENLGACNADVVFIKNIDNVLPDYRKEPTIRYKKALAGYLLEVQQEQFALIRKLKHSPDETAHAAAEEFILRKFGRKLPNSSTEALISQLNRPIRVCGMVKNQGEPGGGPFWVRNKQGEISAQIVEKAQIDPQNKDHQEHLSNATHFNPVDLVCGLRDFEGKLFCLPDFSDPDTGFISIKSQGGRELKAQELPGLWNGAMAHWNTIFAEVPLETFNPVKTVIDLLKPEHQPEAITPSAGS